MHFQDEMVHFFLKNEALKSASAGVNKWDAFGGLMYRV